MKNIGSCRRCMRANDATLVLTQCGHTEQDPSDRLKLLIALQVPPQMSSIA